MPAEYASQLSGVKSQVFLASLKTEVVRQSMWQVWHETHCAEAFHAENATKSIAASVLWEFIIALFINIK